MHSLKCASLSACLVSATHASFEAFLASSGPKRVCTHSYPPTHLFTHSIAMGIDYSLFMLTRFMDGLRAKMPLHEAIVLMLESAGGLAHSYVCMWVAQS